MYNLYGLVVFLQSLVSQSDHQIEASFVVWVQLQRTHQLVNATLEIVVVY